MKKTEIKLVEPDYKEMALVVKELCQLYKVSKNHELLDDCVRKLFNPTSIVTGDLVEDRSDFELKETEYSFRKSFDPKDFGFISKQFDKLFKKDNSEMDPVFEISTLTTYTEPEIREFIMVTGINFENTKTILFIFNENGISNLRDVNALAKMGFLDVNTWRQ